MTYGERVHNFTGNAIIRDHINLIEAEIIYNPEKPKGYFSSFKSKIVGNGSKPPTDTIEVQIYQPSKTGQRKVFASGSGSWLSHLEFDNGNVVWKLDEKYDSWELPAKFGSTERLLDSDSSQRLDLQLIASKNFEEAEKQKH